MSSIYDTPPVAPQAPKKHRKWPWIAGTVVAAVVGIAIGSASAKPAPAPAATAPAPVIVTAEAPPAVTVTAAAPPAAPAVTVTAAAPPAVTVTVTAAAPAPAAPAAPTAGTVPVDGMNMVGTTVQPGTYSASKSGCYWERLSGTSGSFSDIITNEYSPSGTTIVTLDPSDFAFKSQGCAPWTAVG